MLEKPELASLRNLPPPWLALGALGLAYFLYSLFPYAAAALSPSVPPALANKDFANYWAAGQLIRSGEALDLFGPHESYFRHLQGFFGPDYPWHAWSYPPHFLLALWPLGYLSYESSALVFFLLTGGLYVWALRRFSGSAFGFAAAAALPFASHNIRAAQNGFLSAGLILGALAFRKSNPVAAGVMLGCLTFKPQLGILFPFLLAFERNWTAILSAALTAATLVGISAGLFGLEAWSGYVNDILPYQRLVMNELTGVFVSLLTPPFGYGRVLGFSSDGALLLHAAFAIPVFALAVTAFWRVRDPQLRGAALVAATLLVSPYALSYDYGAVAAAIGLLGHRSDRGASWRIMALITAALAPAAMISAAGFYFPAAQLSLLMVFCLALADGRVWDRSGAQGISGR